MANPTSQKLFHRSFCITINNYTETDLEQLQKLKSNYILLAHEVGEETQTPHIQGFLYFKNTTTIARLSKHIPRAHIEITQGTNEQAINYCRKDQNIIFENGKAPIKPGKRNDLTDIRRAVQQGEDMVSIINNYPANYQAIRYAEKIRTYLEPKRNWQPKVFWYYGETGTGKTKNAYAFLGENAYFKDGSKWWDGYDAHESVIIDDFRPSQFSFQELLRLLDRYPHQVEYKGGTRQFLAKTIIITTPLSIEETFSINENINQLQRRISETKEFKEIL
jgi:hypothetical protein